MEFGINNLKPGTLEPGTKVLLVILGPTASGKTELAIKLAQYFCTEIISADSRQFYKELSIGTAKPSEDQLNVVKHHFIGHISIFENYNISRFEKDVLVLLDNLFRTHDVVIMCGGSGLYIDAVCKGLDEQPENNPNVRQKLEYEYGKQGIGYLREELKRLDPEYYRQVDLSNPNRLMRALEVCQVTGRPYSSFRKGTIKKRPFTTVRIGVDISRQVLVERINARTDKMITEGLVEEVRALFPYRHLNALNTVGYKEIFDYLSGKMTLEEAIDKIKINTRRYAKRQMTWFRKDPDIKWFEPESLTPVVPGKTLNG